ncbi:MAG: hypothetical protein E5W82_23900 [Mesorhizobium sp.]|nr:MAG: hypothetical protein E5W82_23900 [Mesorhizobium sp.]TJW43513.1 MAG: hypothetical protein E5W83_17220 [Mesorhizobium sp.]
MTAYTDTELQEIAVWLKDGLSASRIAVRFSALRGSPVSRSAIIGIVHRNQVLKAIGFANPKGGRAGGRPRKNAVTKNAAKPIAPGESGRKVRPSGQAGRVAGTTQAARETGQVAAAGLAAAPPLPARG